MIFLGAAPPTAMTHSLLQLSGMQEVHRTEYEKRLHAESFLITAIPN